MEIPSYFADFLKEIRPTPSHVEDFKKGHRTLRKRLMEDETLGPIIISTFLQGSYRRATANKPQGGKRADVDVIVITKLSMNEYANPEDAMRIFIPFMDEYYASKYKLQGRSIGIELSYVDLDLVITAAPAESEERILKAAAVMAEDTPEDVDDWRLVPSWVPLEKRTAGGTFRLLEAAKREPAWKLSPLYIPDRDAKRWERTHPLRQIEWTWDKNQQTNKHYVNVVKAIKWWRRIRHSTPKYPKGYPVEHLVGLCCPDGISTVAEGVTRTLEGISSRFRQEASLKTTPFVSDHGVPEHNVLRQVDGEDFAKFHEQFQSAAILAREALDESNLAKSVSCWQKIFGDAFPSAPKDDEDDARNEGSGGKISGGYSPRKEVSIIGGGRFA